MGCDSGTVQGCNVGVGRVRGGPDSKLFLGF